MKKIFLTGSLISLLIMAQTKSYEHWEQGITSVAVGAGLIAAAGAALFGVGKFIDSTFFSAEAYYKSAKSTYDSAMLVGIYSVRSFDDLANVFKNNLRNWTDYLLSDCYVIDTYHFLGVRVTGLKTAQEYIATAYNKSSGDYRMRNIIQELETQINHLLSQYMYLRSLCEYHPLFNQHMLIYREKEKLRLEKERIMQESMNAANIANAMREQARATEKAAEKERNTQAVVINNNIVVENRP